MRLSRARGASRADPRFPWLGEEDRFPFPPPSSASPEGILCTGGNLPPGMLLSAYEQGSFPWFNDGDPIIWWNPDPRFALLPGELHASRTMRKIIKKRRFELSLDRSFGEVIRACSGAPRPGQRGTWITEDMIAGYERLHELGYAHSVEARLAGRLVGGLYGVSLGSAFFGESMFSLEPDASKAAFIPFVWALREAGFTLIDSQVRTAHVESMGGKEISRGAYLGLLGSALGSPTLKGDWSTLIPGFPGSEPYRSLCEGSGSGVS
ncbi:MAG: leucyl/phenylalanyl-tRNA--protein transferase [Spirochaetes bacterium]|nr:leucyl/phenylalanyl-tRNA--protein transferase [Spirochaetota bacterium]